MPEWAETTPWWVVAGLAVTFIAAIIKFARWTGRVDSRLNALDKAIAGLRKEIAEIREDIRKLLHGQSAKTISSDSPLKLTELGQRISTSLDTPSIADGLARELRARAEGKQPYDIQELSFDFVRDEYRPSDEVDARIKQCAYENGLDRDAVLDVLAVQLRDRLLELTRPAVS